MFESHRVLVGLLLGASAAGAGVSCGATTSDGAADTGPADGGPDTAKAADASDAGEADAGQGPVLITEPDQGMKPVYDFIRSAQHKIDMTMYELNDTTATTLLVNAAKRGVSVRVVLDQNLEMNDNEAAYKTLSSLDAASVVVHWANPVYAATHQKTITIDGTTSAIMTLNMAEEFYSTSRDFALITTDAADVAAIESTFEADLVNASVTPQNATNLVWSPTSSQTALVDLINGAKISLLVENEEMSYDIIVSALATAAARGVDVKIVMNGSREWDANFTALTAAGAHVATYHDGAIYIHAKVIVADYGTSGAKVFLGSENFSHASLTENRELGIVTSDPATMTSIQGTLTKDFEGATPFAPPMDAGTPFDAAGTGDGSGQSDSAGAGDSSSPADGSRDAPG